MKRIKNILMIILHWLPMILWMGLIFYLSSIPNLKTDFGTIYDIILRKGAHITEYFILAMLVWWALKSFNIWENTKFNLVFIISFLYAVSDEWHQSFVMTRSGNFYDISIDFIGIIMALVFLLIKTKK